MRKSLIITILTIIFTNTYGNKVDSLLHLLPTTKDSAQVEVFNELSWALRNNQTVQSIAYAKQAIDLATKLNYNTGLLRAYSFIGVAFRNLGNYSDAMDYYQKSMSLASKTNDLEQLAYAFNNMGNLCLYQKQYEQGLQYLKRALLLGEQLKNKKIIAYANLYLGRTYAQTQHYDESLEYLNKSLQLRLTMKNPDAIAACQKSIGDLYYTQNDIAKAVEYYLKITKLAENNQDIDMLADVLIRLSQCYLQTNRVLEAKDFAEKSLKIATNMNTKLRIRDASQSLAKIHESLGEIDMAFKYQKMVTQYTDSMFNQDLAKRITLIQFNAEQQKKQDEINLLNKDQKIKDLTVRRQRLFISFLAGILILVFALALILYRVNNKVNRVNRLLELKRVEIEQKNEELNVQNEQIAAQRDNLEILNTELESQRDEITMQNDEIKKQMGIVELQRDELTRQKLQITDSIQYAKRIQDALLPSLEDLSAIFPEMFVLFRPKNIVSGDFYWFQTVGDVVYFAVADCTGHGVPGAFMSMLGISNLNEILRHNQTIEVNQILEELRIHVKHSLNQRGRKDDPRDGMNIALCSFNTKSLILKYSGAYNPIWLITQTNECSNKITELPAVKNPIGAHRKEYTFDIHEIQLHKDDILYLFSDGYYDQFCCDRKTKFLKKNFRELLLQIQFKTIAEQHTILIETLNRWQGTNEQVDDITVIGIRI